MAPKRRGSFTGIPRATRRRTARRPARPPSPVDLSSSSSSTPSAIPSPPSPPSPNVDFLAGKAITTGRKVDFDFFESEGFSIGRMIKEMGWETICSLDVPTYPALVKEFYGNLSRGDGGLVSFVKGTRIHLTADILGDLLSIPVVGLTGSKHSDRGAALSRLLGRDVAEFEEVVANQLNLEHRLLHNICSRILFPKTGRFEYVSERDIVLMDSILSGYPLNLANMMIGYMAEAGSKARSTLPYGMVLTMVFRSQGVNIAESEPQKKLRHTDYYNLATLHRMGFKKVDGTWIRRGQAAPTDVRGDEGVAEPVSDFIGEVPGPSVAGPSVPGPSHTSPGPRTFTPPPAATTPTPQDSLRFSDIQLSQLRELLTEHEDKIKNEVRSQLSEVRQHVQALEVKLEKFESTFGCSADVLKNELQSVFELIKGIAGDSVAYSQSNAELQANIASAATKVENLFDKFINIQKGGMEKILAELKKLLMRGSLK